MRIFHRSTALRATLALVALVFSASAAWAHAVVFPRTAEPGAYERYVLRVPNERDVPTRQVEITFPAGVRVVSFQEVAGWTLEVRRGADGAVTGAVWTGTLPAERFIEFPFVAVNPKTEMTIVWPATQTYANGERVEWSGAEDSKTPASRTHIAAPAEAKPSSTGTYLGGAALLLSLLALGLALRKP